MVGEFNQVAQLPGKFRRSFRIREVLGRLLAFGEYQDVAEHCYQVYFLMCEGDVGAVFRPDLQAGVKAEAAIRGGGSPGGVHGVERQQGRDRPLVVAVSVEFVEPKVCAAPAAREAPRVAIGARLVPVPFAPQEDDDLSAPAAGERQASARRPDIPTLVMLPMSPCPPVQLLRAAEPNGTRGASARSSAFR